MLAHRGRDSVEIAVFLRLERDARVAHRHVAEEDSERREEAFPVSRVHVLVAVVAVQQRGGMERDVGQTLLGERTLVQANALGHVLVLLVEHEREEIIPVPQVVAPGFVYEQAELAQFAPLKQRKPGKTSPALGSPPIGEPSTLYHRMLFLATEVVIKGALSSFPHLRCCLCFTCGCTVLPTRRSVCSSSLCTSSDHPVR